MKRGPQSAQSVPYAQLPPVTPAAQDVSPASQPSWQNELFPYGPPRPCACGRHSLEQSMGGGVGGDEGGGSGGEDGDGGGGEGEGGGGLGEGGGGE
eukprot:scaffold85920_cov45-Phaeocystis_antarctica.AAC.1